MNRDLKFLSGSLVVSGTTIQDRLLLPWTGPIDADADRYKS
jgi:hypothetical protein